jgi:hypothetical protein
MGTEAVSRFFPFFCCKSKMHSRRGQASYFVADGRPMLRAWYFLLSFSVALVACSAAESGDFNTSAQSVDALSSELPCAVDDVLKRKCRTCHKAPPVYGAPMPLVTWTDMEAPAPSDPAKKVYEVVGERIHDEDRPMPPFGPLATADMATLDTWIAAGAPKGSCGGGDAGTDAPSSDDAAAPTEPDGGLGCQVDQSFVPSKPWTVSTEANDEYVCYGIDVNVSQKRHAIAIGPRIQNERVVHHLDLFQAQESFGAEPQPCSPFASANWRMVYAWAPGGKNMILPAEAGFPLEGTTHYVVQVHYSNVTHAPGETDTSGIEMCTTDTLRTYDADVMAFGSERFTVPPRSNYELGCESALPDSRRDLHIFGVMPHLHNYGKTFRQTIERTTGESVEIASQPHWDTNNQVWFSSDVSVHPGDRVKTSCTWVNPTDQGISFGDKATDEMCYGFTMYYPRITASDWSWSVPSKTSTCRSPAKPL